MIEEGKVSNSNASSKIIPLMISSKEFQRYGTKYNLIIEDNKDEIKKFIDDTLKNILKSRRIYASEKRITRFIYGRSYEII